MLIAWVVTAASSSVQGVIGFGMATLSVPILALIDTRLAPVPQLLIAAPMAGFMFWRERHQVDWSGLWWVMGGRLIGVPAGLVLLSVVDNGTLTLIIGILVLLAVVVVGFGVHIQRNPRTSLIAGATAGVFGVVASVGGPPLALIYRNERGALIRASLAAVFFSGICVSAVGRAVTGHMTLVDLQVAGLLLPAMALGVWVSKYLHDRVEGPPLKLATLVLSAAAAIGLIVKTLVG